MQFSDLLAAWDHPTNALYTRKTLLQDRGAPPKDLITGHPPVQRKVSRYKPDPLGQLAAREAIARFYRAEGFTVESKHILLTPGTSLSYWYAFKLFANPGDEVLCPQPSYPLFQSIADLADVRLTFYPLRATNRWAIDFASLEAAITPRTQAIVLVSPHNPTGSVATEKELSTLAVIAKKHALPIILDEVFCSFVFVPSPPRLEVPLLLTLNGFSKMFARPGAKIGWMAVSGQEALVARTMKALEMMSDTFLPVNEAAQAQIPKIFGQDRVFLKNYQKLARRTHETTETLLKSVPGISWIAPEGGFYWTIQLPAGVDEEKMALVLLEEGYLVHPGYFYDMKGSHLVFYFLQKPETLRRFTKALNQLLL